MDEFSVEDESSSSATQEKSSEDTLKVEVKAVKKITNDINHRRNCLPQNACKETILDYNCCSTNTKSNNKIKYVNSGSSCIKKYLLRDSNLLFTSDLKSNPNRNFDGKIEQAQARTIILNVEDKSQCKQVSL